MGAFVRLLVVSAIAFSIGCGGGGSKRGPTPLPPPDTHELNDDLTDCSWVPLDFLDGDLTLHDKFDEDYFCFDLTVDSFVVITAEFTHSQGDIDIQLIDMLGRTPISMSQTQQDIEVISKALVVGQYSVLVYSPTQETNRYGLEIAAQQACGSLMSDSREPNGSFCGYDLGNVALNPAIEPDLSIHVPTDEDYFCFTLLGGAAVSMDIGFLHGAGNLDMELLDANQVPILGASSFTNHETLSATLQPGMYSLHVYGVPDPVTLVPDTNCYSLTVF